MWASVQLEPQPGSGAEDGSEDDYRPALSDAGSFSSGDRDSGGFLSDDSDSEPAGRRPGVQFGAPSEPLTLRIIRKVNTLVQLVQDKQDKKAGGEDVAESTAAIPGL